MFITTAGIQAVCVAMTGHTTECFRIDSYLICSNKRCQGTTLVANILDQLISCPHIMFPLGWDYRCLGCALRNKNAVENFIKKPEYNA